MNWRWLVLLGLILIILLIAISCISVRIETVCADSDVQIGLASPHLSVKSCAAAHPMIHPTKEKSDESEDKRN